MRAYTDEAKSGALYKNRRALQSMLRDAAAGDFETVVVFDLDRIGRKGEKTMVVLNDLADVGVSVTEYPTDRTIDIDSFEGEMLTFLKARFAQEEREKARKRTRDALVTKASKGHVTGGACYGYKNVRVGNSHVERHVFFEPEASVVRDVYARFAAGESIYGLRPTPECLEEPPASAQAGRRARRLGLVDDDVRQLLKRDAYRGLAVFGKTRSLYGRELGKKRFTVRGDEREEAQLRTDPSTWQTVEVPGLRIVDEKIWQRVADRLADIQQRDVGGRPSKKTRGVPLLTGGLLICPECGGNFETREGKYECARRRRKGTCENTLRFDIAQADADVLDTLENTSLSPEAVAGLLRTISSAPADERGAASGPARPAARGGRTAGGQYRLGPRGR